jgi:general stress protein 26
MAAHGCQVNLSFSDPKSQNYVSVSGTGAVSQDRDEMKKRWSEANKAW